MDIKINGITVKEKDVYSGKANDVLQTDDADVLAIRATDRASAGDGKRKDIVPGKAETNHLFSVLAFERLKKAGIRNHFIMEDRDSCIKLVHRTNPIKLEVIARMETAGSFCKTFKLPAGIKFEDAPFVEFTYKSDPDHDPRVSDWSVKQMGLLKQDDVRDEINWIRSETATATLVVAELANAIDCELIDLKFEFGRLPDGSIILIDEISPDTCRLRDKATGKSLDKDPFRKGCSVETASKVYAEVLTRLVKLEKGD